MKKLGLVRDFNSFTNSKAFLSSVLFVSLAERDKQFNSCYEYQFDPNTAGIESHFLQIQQPRPQWM